SNIIGELNIFEAIRRAKINPWIQIAGSSEEYGMVHSDEVPIKETNPLRPLSPYGVSKVAQDLLAYQYYMSYKLNVVRTRAFNHSGPRRGNVFVCSEFAKQIAEIEKGKREPVILVGNLDAQRDFTDVRDIVKAYWLGLDKCKPGEVYNICSGKAYKISEVLDILISLSKVKIEIKEDPSKMRPSDVPYLGGDSTKFRDATGWKPEIPFERTLKDLLNYWREWGKRGTEERYA
ncbi:GDP-mannose 4,6-dehydratase, partial [candidate division WOR-3 bacterium]|nr:GDP-mannose 4,6-dehydratase [candidate division WOR-3 bacterium]